MGNTPNIRFKGFTDDWEQRKFGDVGSVAMCKRIFKEQTSDEGEVPFYKIGTFGGEPDAFISRKLFDEYKTKYPYPHKGDILISASGSIGRTIEFTGKDEYFQDSNIVWLKHENEIDNNFLKVLYSIVEWSFLMSFLQTDSFVKIVLDNCTGTSYPAINSSDLSNLEISLPKSFEEQKKVGKTIISIDNLRPPMSPQGLIQAFSRTNRLYDQNKEYGQIVTFRSPKEYKKKINDALVLYSKGGIGQAIAEDWETVLNNFVLSLKTIRTFAPTPADVNGLSKKQKKTFIKLFRDLDHDYAHLKSFSTFEPKILDEYGFSQQIYEDYAAVYNNVIEELKKDPPDDTGDEPIRDDYDLVAYSKFKIDFEYIVELLQGFVDFLDQKDIEFNEAEFEHKLLELKEIVKDFAEDNSKLSDLLLQVLDEIEQDKAKFMGQDMSVIINQMRYAAIDKEIEKFSKKWYIPFEAVKYEAYNYKDGELANENKLKELADYATYKVETSEALPKFKFNGALIKEFKEMLMPEIGSLIE